MLRVIKLNDGDYIVMTRKHAIHGNLVKTSITMAELGISWDHIEEGLASMERNEHNFADYGINGTFIFSKKIVD